MCDGSLSCASGLWELPLALEWSTRLVYTKRGLPPRVVIWRCSTCNSTHDTAAQRRCKQVQIFQRSISGHHTDICVRPEGTGPLAIGDLPGRFPAELLTSLHAHGQHVRAVYVRFDAKASSSRSVGHWWSATRPRSGRCDDCCGALACVLVKTRALLRIIARLTGAQ